MASSFIRYAGDGATTDFNVTFGYLETAHVGLKVDGVVATFIWLSATQIRADVAPAASTIVEVRRTTPTTPVVDFVDGAVLFESDLDKAFLQVIYIAEEAIDTAGDTIQPTGDGHWDADGKRITNVADPVDAQDVVTKAYGDATYSSVASAASAAESAASAAAALASEIAAAASAAAALVSENNAAASAASIDVTDFYTKAQQDATDGTQDTNISNNTASIALKAPLASPALTGNPTAPTQTAGNNSTRLATTAFVTTAVAASAGIDLTRETPVATTSGTSHDITGIPAGANRITIMFKECSTGSASPLMVQIGDAGGIEATGYISSAGDAGDAVLAETIGLLLQGSSSDSSMATGHMTLVRYSGNSWVSSGDTRRLGTSVHMNAGHKTLSAELTQLRLTTQGGTGTFDNGAFNIIVEV